MIRSLTENRSFQRVYRRGRSAVGACMAVYVRPNRSPDTGIGFTVSSKLGCAVRRNRIRRRLKEAWRLGRTPHPGFDVVIVGRSRAFDTPFDRICSELAALGKNLGLWP